MSFIGQAAGQTNVTLDLTRTKSFVEKVQECVVGQSQFKNVMQHLQNFFNPEQVMDSETLMASIKEVVASKESPFYAILSLNCADQVKMCQKRADSLLKHKSATLQLKKLVGEVKATVNATEHLGIHRWKSIA